MKAHITKTDLGSMSWEDQATNQPQNTTSIKQKPASNRNVLASNLQIDSR